MKPWFKVVKPHKDIQEGNLDESVFAANLKEVAEGKGREVYTNSKMFFEKTYVTNGIKSIARRVIQGLNGSDEAENRDISLQTGFGGGKTHTLITLYHIAKGGKSLTKNKYTNELFEYTGKPKFENAKIAVFTNATNDPVQGRKVDGITLRTIWGEIAYQLGGKKGYEIVRRNDEERTAPKGLIKKVIEMSSPSLILIDELADYCVVASAVKVGDSNLSDQTISFIQELTEAISQTKGSVLIATLPASAQELASSEVSANILNALENRLRRLGAEIKPVENEEIFEIVRRRLFEEVGSKSDIDDVISNYTELYHSLFTELPSYVQQNDYKQKMIKSYPFHPELIDIFRMRWASNPYFQRTRGVLRLLASIVSDLWKRQQSLTGSNYLIQSGDINLSNLPEITGQITSLYGINYDAVIKADISGNSSNAFKIDNEVKTYGNYSLTQGIAAAFLLCSFGAIGHNQGLSIEELKLQIVKPESFNHNDINSALDKFENAAYYLHNTAAPTKRYWFETTPNINILLNQSKANVKKNEINDEIMNRIKENTKNDSVFNILVDPPFDIPEQKKLSLIILRPECFYISKELNSKADEVIKRLSTKRGNSERMYRNTILFLLPSETGLQKLTSTIKEYIASQNILSEYSNQLETEQKDKLKKKINDISKKIENELCVAYSGVVKYSLKEGVRNLEIKQFKENLSRQIDEVVYNELKTSEWILETVGSNTLKKNSLFPEPDKAIKTIDIYEAFLRYDDKPMIKNTEAVQRSLLRYCQNGEFAIAAGDDKNFQSIYYKESVPNFDVTDETYWIVDKSLYKKDSSELNEKHGDDKKQPEIVSNGDKPADGINNERKIRSLTISGDIPLEQYTQVYTSFITPLVHNNIKINITIKAKSTNANPITENSQNYKIIKESAKQLGLEFDEETE